MARIEGQTGIWECSACGGMHGHPLHKVEWLAPEDRHPDTYCTSAVQQSWLCAGCLEEILRRADDTVATSCNFGTDYRRRDLLRGTTVITEADEAFDCQCAKGD